MKNVFPGFRVSLVLSLAAAALAMRLGFGAWYKPELWWVLGLLVFNAFFALFVYQRAIGQAITPFLFYSLIVNSFRIFLLILAILYVYIHNHHRFNPFVTAVLAGYFCFLFGEVWGLHALAMKGMKKA